MSNGKAIAAHVCQSIVSCSMYFDAYPHVVAYGNLNMEVSSYIACS